MNSLAIVAIEAQKLHGYAQPLSQVSSVGEYKVEQNSVDGLVYITENGGAWTPLVGGGGGGSLDAAYLLGSQINVIDANGPVVLDTAQTSGEVLLVSSSAAPTLAAPLTGISVDMSGVDPNGFALTGMSISMATGTPGTSAITGLSITGASSTKAKARKQALLYINSRASAASAAQFIVRNTSATAGSLVLVGWDDVDFNGVTQNSVLTGATHMLTLDGQTNVTAGAQEFVGAKILVPKTSDISTYGLYVTSLQEGALSPGIFVNMAPAVSAGVRGQTITMGANTSIAGNALVANWVGTAGATTGVIRSRLVAASPSTGNLVLFRADTGATTLSAALTGYETDFSSCVPGAQVIVGAKLAIPGTTNAASAGVYVTSNMRAGVLFYGDIDAPTSQSGALVGLGLELNADLTTNNLALQGINVTTAQTSNPSGRGISVTSRVTNASASVAEFLLSPGVTTNANVVVVTGNANHQAVSGSSGYLGLWTQQGAAGRGLKLIADTFSGAFSGGEMFSVYRSGTWSGGGAESIGLTGVVRDVLVTASATLSAPLMALYDGPTNDTGTLTQSNNNLTITRATARSTGTVNLSGSLIGLVHAPTGTIGTDTTALITGTTISKSGTVLSFTTTGTFTGSLTMLELVARDATPGANVVIGSHVRMPATTNVASHGFSVSSAQSSGSFFAGQASPSMSMSGDIAGVAIDLFTNVTTNDFAIFGYRASLAQTAHASARGVSITARHTASTASVGEFELVPGAASNSNVIVCTMGSNVASTTGTNGCILYGTIAGASGRGLRVQTTGFTNAFGGGLAIFYRTGTWSGGGSESTSLVQSYRDQTISGVATLSAPMLQVTSTPEVSGGTTTYSADEVTIQRIVRRTGGTANLSGSLLSISHAPTGTINTDTTVGASITMTPTGASTVVGASINMANANAQGAALTIAHSGTNANQLVFTSAPDGSGAHIYGPLVGQLNIFAGQRADAGAGRSIAIYASDGVSSTNGGGDVLLSGGDPVSTGSYGYVKAQTAFAEASSAVTYNASGTTDINVSLGNSFTATVATGITTWTFSNPPASGNYYGFTLTLTDGGLFAQTWPASVKWPGGGAPVLTASGVDVLVFFTIDGGTTWRGVVAQADSK